MEFSPEANSLCFTRITWGGSGRLSVGGWGFVFFLLALEATIGSFLGSARAHPYTEQSSGYNTIAPNGQIRAAKKLLEECLRFCKYLTGDCGWRNSNTDKVFLNICSTVEWVEGMPKLHIHVLRSTAAGDYNGGKIHCRIHGLFTVRAEVSRVDALKEEQHWEVLLPQRGCIHISIYTAVNLQPVQWPIVLIGVELAGWASQEVLKRFDSTQACEEFSGIWKGGTQQILHRLEECEMVGVLKEPCQPSGTVSKPSDGL